MRGARGCAGFTFFEVVLALALLGISLLLLVEQSADNTRADADRAARLVAYRTVRNEVHRLRAADPFADPATGRFPFVYLTDRTGNRIAAEEPGAQTVTVSRRISCVGGYADLDNATGMAPRHSCGVSAMPLAEFTIRVDFPSRYTDSGTDAIEQIITVRPVADRHGAAWSPAS